jgi:hypothetical protein
MDDYFEYTLNVYNISTNQAFSGGSFYLFKLDDSGNLPQVLHQALDGTLASGDEVEIPYDDSSTVDMQFVFVYQGTIGIDGSGNPLDPVDQNIAIAATRFFIDPGLPNPSMRDPDKIAVKLAIAEK